MEKSIILKSNLAIALCMAIEYREKEEKALKFKSESALLAGWKENLRALENGTLEIK